MKRLPAMIVASLVLSGAAFAQVMPSALGITTPLGIGPGAPVAPLGLPLGATQLSTPGVSPVITGVPQGMMGSGSGCDASAGIATGMPSSGALFDGNMNTAIASAPCTASGTTARPTQSASSPSGMGALSAVGRVGVPMGSTELGVGGVSPSPDITSIVPPSPLAMPLMTAPSSLVLGQPSIMPQAAAGAACAGVPGNINSTGTMPGTSAGAC